MLTFNLKNSYYDYFRQLCCRWNKYVTNIAW